MNKRYKRVFMIVMDSLGIGEMEDASKYGDKGTNTFVHISEKVNGLNIPNLNSLGIADLGPIKGTYKVSHPHSYVFKSKEASWLLSKYASISNTVKILSLLLEDRIQYFVISSIV